MFVHDTTVTAYLSRGVVAQPAKENMSVKVITWAFDQDLPPVKKFILVALADWADGDGVAFPGQLSLASKTGISERTLRTHLKELEEAGFLTRAKRYTEGGKRTSDEYRLSLLPANIAGSSTGNLRRDYRQTVAGTEAIRKEPSEEPSVVNARVRTKDFDALLDRYFEGFWKNYPRKVGKVAAKAAYMAAIKRKVSPFVIAEGLDRQLPDLSSREERYIPHPATWLNGERYNDDVATGQSVVNTANRTNPHSVRDKMPMDRAREIMNIQPLTERRHDELR